MKETIKSVFLLFCSSFILICSCTKDNSVNNSNDNETQTASDNMLAQSINDEVTTVAVQSEDNLVIGNLGDSVYGFLLSPCAAISINTVSSPHQLIIDFGNTSCKCLDGKYRRGKILVSYTGLYKDSGSSHAISFDNYYVNNYKLEGTQIVVNNGHNKDGNITFSVDVNSTITDTSDNKLIYTSTRTREWIAGAGTSGLSGWLDDVYSITGTASGTSFNGTSYTAKITSPLIVALNCKWTESGKIDFKPTGSLTRTIDFGNGGCDNKATVSIGGLSFDIFLP